MTCTKIYSKQSWGLFVFLYLLIISCNDSDKSKSATSNVNTSQVLTAAVPTDSKSPLTTAENTSDSTKERFLNYIPLKALWVNFTTLFHKKNFYKFVFIPYERDDKDKVRLYCYALSKDTASDKPIGTAFIISKDGKGEDPRKLRGAIYDNSLKLALSYEEMDELNQKPPSTVINLDFIPEKKTDGSLTYDSYHIFKTNTDTKIILNPSPPHLLLHIFKH